MNVLRAVGEVAAIVLSVGAVVFFAVLGRALSALTSGSATPGESER
jgi:hypothetical protein